MKLFPWTLHAGAQAPAAAVERLPELGVPRIPALTMEQLALAASLFFTMFCNHRFWSAAMAGQQGGWLFAMAVFVFITALQGAVLALLLNRWSARPLLAALFIASAAATWYMDRYTVFFDADMVRNVLRTDIKEARELLSLNVAVHMLVYAGIPCFVLWRIPLRRHALRRAVLTRCAFVAVMIAVAAGSLLLVFQDFSALMRNQKEVRFLVTPGNYLVSLARVLAADTAKAATPKTPIDGDARLAAGWGARTRPMLFVLVVGETTRAANWGLNGYARQTTPELAKLDVLNFTRATSCGTNTEVSVPCMFSPFGRHDYDEKKIRGHGSLLDILQHAGLKTLWRDNQSGCKGVCDGVETQQLDSSTDAALCDGERCLDEIMLKGLGAEVSHVNGNMVVVLHQLGNHGPAYYKRHPAELRQFTPTCDTPDLGKCSRQEIVNSFDNATLYTDRFLARTIAFLKTQDKYDTAMLYLSDHGESLGENGIFLHGMPYAIAPKEQTSIPMVMWMSPGFASSFGLRQACLRQKTGLPVSQDNLFHSMLGMLQVASPFYDKSYDIVSGCRA